MNQILTSHIRCQNTEAVGWGSDHPAPSQGGVGKTKLRDLPELLVLLSEEVHGHFLLGRSLLPLQARSVVRELA